MGPRGYDMVVVGAGIVGLAHAWMALRAGLSVAVVERDHRCLGASIRNFGFVTVTGQREGDTWRRARRSRDLWAELAPQAGIAVIHEGLWLLAQRPLAMDVLEAFKETAMGEACELVSASALSDRAPFLKSDQAQGALYSPHELRVESRQAVGQVAEWLAQQGVDFFFNEEVLSVERDRVLTSAQVMTAERIVLCPGTHLNGVAAPYLRELSLGLTQLQMLRIRPRSNYRQTAAVMSDLSLVRYAGYTGLDAHRPLLAQLQQECGPSLEAGIHLIVVQSEDGSLVVGDSHHDVRAVDPFGSEAVDRLILQHCEETLRLGEVEVVDRWLGVYPTGGAGDALVVAPAPSLRVVCVTSGTGASTAFGLAEDVFRDWGI